MEQKLTLLISFRSAQEGGNWIKNDEASRYFDALKPLGSMLRNGLCSEEVVECLIALAIAVGEEKYWKNINGPMIDCMADDEIDMKVIGLGLLYGMLKALGEELVVLMPELLPSLSECLEERDTNVVKLAKNIISLAENLCGESFSSYM